MLTFQEERFHDICKEASQNLFLQHWYRSALDKHKIALSPDWKMYRAMQDAGTIAIVTVRDAAVQSESTLGKLVGYLFVFIHSHFHYAKAGPMAYADAYFVLPEYHKGGTGAKLFGKMRALLKERGVVKFYVSCKVHEDLTPFFQAMGFKLTDYMFAQLL